MAITFFSINGAGGGSGGSAVNTDNGISGDGSVATPVILGGKPLTANTTIELAGNTFDFHDIDVPGNSSDASFSEGNIAFNFVLAAGGGSSYSMNPNGLLLRVSSVANNITFLNFVDETIITMGAVAAGITQKLVRIDSTSGKGIEIQDDTDSVGMTGQALFAVNGDPKQFAQYGHITASNILTLSNGLTVSGTDGQLGGTIAHDTTINNVSHDLFIGDSGFNNSYVDIDNTAVAIGGVVVISGGGGAGTKFGRASFDDVGVNISANNSAIPGSGCGFIIRSLNDGTAAGIVLQDQNNKGMIGSALFPVTGDPTQFAQYGNLANLNKQFTDVAGQMASVPALVAFTVPSGDGMFLVGAYTLFRLGAGSVAITCTYTDILSNAITATVSVVACSAANPNTQYASIYIKAKAGTNVNLNWVLTGVMTYDAGGFIEYIAP